MAVPWAYVRREIAQRWGVPPWEVDAAPTDEVRLELAIRRIEGEAAAARQRSVETRQRAASRARG